MARAYRTLLILSCAACIAVTASTAAPQYRPGGKLAGEVLPLYPTHHGEPAGYPGSIAKLAEEAVAEREAAIKADPELEPYAPGSAPFTPQGMAPKEHLYDGSVEHSSYYWFKYTPVRTMFDRQSLIKNWRTTESPAAKGAVEKYAEPVYWLIRHGTARDTGYRNDPVEVVRARVGRPAFDLDCGVLESGLYCIRVVGAVETEHIKRHRLPLYMTMTVNDGLNGEPTTYRMRAPYVDEFYSVVEFYFHAPEKRRYKATVAVEEGSMVDLLVYNLDLHDALAGCELRPIKEKRTISADLDYPAEPVANTPELLAEEAQIWNSFPPLNCHTRYVYGMGSNDGKGNWPNLGAGGLTPAEVEEKHGKWDWRVGRNADPDVLLVNKKLDLTYTLSDYLAGRPLPDPYPFKDRGLGVFTPAADEGGNGQNLWPVAEGLGRRMRSYNQVNVKAFTDKGDMAAGREAALRLIRVAYALPAMEARTSMHAVLIQPGSWGRDHGCRRRDPQRHELAGQVLALIDVYDTLFDLIKAERGLAESVGRFIPWVKTPEDVIALLDTYLVQHAAKRILRYQMYASNVPHWILTPVNCLGDREFTRPWMEWLFSSAFIYPLPPSGLQDLVTSANGRNGMGYISSHYYSHGEQAAQIASYLDDYVAKGGLPEYNLGDPILYPKPLAACHWYYDSRTAGNYFPRIGDVCGPDKGYGHPIVHNKHKSLVAQSIRGWRWSKDPKFAWGIATYGDEKQFAADEWAAIAEAAATVKRAPWYENRSRVLASWGGFLESGIESDDDRLRRSAMVRIGVGWGHHHNDAMDLQLHALGYPMTIDGGQRPGYTKPGDRGTIGHNLVLIDGKQWMAHAWVTALSDVEDARYMRVESLDPERPATVRLYTRQVALIDVDEKNSYVFDVQRVAGGRVHTHAFHAMLEDELVHNAQDTIKPDQLTGDELAFANAFQRDVPELPRSSQGFAGRAPEVLEATWRMQREKQGRYGLTEEHMHRAIWDPDSPRKYTRLHLLGQKGARVMSAWSHCRQWGYGWTHLYTRREAEEDLESVFPAVIEPFAGDAIIAERRLLDIADNETDAQRAVALKVTTHRGHEDMLFSDGRPEKTRTTGGSRIAAEFAMVSTDAQGLRLATLTGGSLLEHPLVRITPALSRRSATVKAVDYQKKTMTLDAEWADAPLLAGRVFEVGVPAHRTTYTAVSAENRGGATSLTVTEGAQYYLSRIKDVDEEKQRVTCAIGFAGNDKRPLPGIDRHWVASNEAGTKFWRAEYIGDVDGSSRYLFELDSKVSKDDFGDNGGFRLWEYGVGDEVRQSTFVSVRRRADGAYDVRGDTACEIMLNGKTHRITVEQLAAGPVLVKAK